MYCRSRPQYRSDLGWILGVAFLGTLTRSARPAQGFTYVRCCSAPPASSPHGLAAPGRIVSRRPHLRAVAFGLRLLPTCSAEDFHLQSRVHAWHTKAGLRPPPSAADGLDRTCHPAIVCHQEFDGEERLKCPQVPMLRRPTLDRPLCSDQACIDRLALRLGYDSRAERQGRFRCSEWRTR